MRLLLDTGLSTEGVGRLLAKIGHDVGGLDQEPELEAFADDEVLELAAQDGSVLVTLNVGDYPPILRDWLAAGKSHAGVILLHGIPPAEFDAAFSAIRTCLVERPEQASWIDHAVLAGRPAST